MSSFLKLSNGASRTNAVNGTDIASGSATSLQFLAANGSGGSAFRSLAAGDLPAITLTGNVTGSASGGSIATTIAGSAVTLGMLANLAANSVIGNSTGSPATPTAVPLASAATASAIILRDANANARVNNLIESFTTTATAAGTTTLTVSSTYGQQFTGATTQTVVLPDATTLAIGQSFFILNRSSGVVTVNSNGGGLVQTMAAGSQTVVTVVTIGTSAGTWDSAYSTTAGGGGTASPLTTKGDIYTYTSTNARHAVPGDYGRLVPDSAQADGWRSASYSQLQNGRPGKNYIQYADFENNATTGWSLGTVGTLINGIPTGSPAFGSGASGNLSISTVSSGQLAGSYSLSLASSAATVQGNMLATQSYPIDIADQAKVLTFRFAYQAAAGAANCNFSGTSSNSFAVAVYDVTNSAWLGVAGQFNLVQSSGVGIATGTFQTASTTANIRLVIYFPNATAGAATLYVDDVYVGPQVSTQGPAISDWTQYTLAVTSTGTAPTKGTIAIDKAFWRRVGDSMEIRYEYRQTAAGAAGTGDYLFGLPSGYSIDTTKVDISTSNNIIVGYAEGNNSSTGLAATSRYAGSVMVYNSTNLGLALPSSPGAGTKTVVGASLYDFANVSLILTFFATVPIAGWSSNSVMSNDTDTRIVAAIVTPPSGTTSANTPVIWSLVQKDTHAAYNSSTGQFTAPVSGFYHASVSLNLNSGGAGEVKAYVNNSIRVLMGFMTTSQEFGGACTVYLNAGDTFDVRATVTISMTASNDAGMQIFRLSGPAVIAATETVSATYILSSNQTLGAIGQINFDTKVDDSHNVVTTGAGAWKFTCPVSGRYMVCFSTQPTVSGSPGISTYKNGIELLNLGNPSTTNGAAFCTIIKAVAGDYLDIRSQAATLRGSATVGTQTTQVSIYRIGN